jgi:hypothetical protein
MDVYKLDLSMGANDEIREDVGEDNFLFWRTSSRNCRVREIKSRGKGKF